MKKQLFIAVLSAVTLLTSQTSCQQLAQRAAEAAAEDVADEHGKLPRYLRDSEEWGPVVRQEQQLADFESIQTAGLVDIVFTQGEEFSVVAEGNEKVLPHYDFSVQDGTLIVVAKKENIRNFPFMRLLVTAPTLQGINLSGAGDVMMRRPVEFFNDLDIRISGTGDIEIDSLLCDAFHAEIRGAGDIEMRRMQCQSAHIAISGAGETTIKRLTCQDDASVTITGSGDAEVKVKCRNLTVRVDGDGEVDIDCNCQLLTAHASGTGRIDLEGEAGDVKTRRDGLADISTKFLRISRP